MSPLLETGLEALQFARGVTLAFAESLSDDQFFERACDGGNHAAFIIGHIASTDDFVLAELTGSPPTMPESLLKLVGGGAPVSDDRDVYPSRGELMAMLADRREASVSYFKSFDDEGLLAPIEGKIAQFGKNRAVLMATTAWHEGMHAGQITVARKRLGMAPVLG